MTADWDHLTPDLQMALLREALMRARQLLSAQAEMLAEKMLRGTLPRLDGPDALRLLAMIVGQEGNQAGQLRP